MSSASTSPSKREHVWQGIAWVTLLYIALIFFTKPISWGDTIVYAPQIVDFSKGVMPPSQIWEFGHLFWRPIGILAWHLGRAWWSRNSGGSQVLEVYAALQMINVILSFAAALATFGIAWRISRRVLTAALVSSAFLGWNAVINYFQSGTAYVPGLAMQLIGLYLLLGDNRGVRRKWHAWLAGVTLALSVCLWFPYLFGLPAVFLLAYLWQPDDRRARLRWVANAVAVCAIFGVLSYAAGMSLARIGTLAALKAWVSGSAHGYQPGQRYFRVVTGLPRSLVEVGQSGLVLKRFVLRDPYAPVGLRDLLQLVLFKLVLFYAAFVSLSWIVYRDRESRPIAAAFFLGWGLILFFAVVLFEPGQPERWLPAFAVLVPAVACVFRRGKAAGLGAIVVAVLLAAIWLNNFIAYATPGQPGAENPAVARLLALKPVTTPGNLIALLSFRDDINTFAARFPFHPLNRPGAVHLYTLTEPGTADAAQWPSRFAARGLDTWRKNGDLWISKRLTAGRPLPAWGWVEGDDPRLQWRDIPAFFQQFSFDADLGGADGFLRIARVQSNQTHLEDAARNTGGVH